MFQLTLVSDIAIFVLKRDVKLQLTPTDTKYSFLTRSSHPISWLSTYSKN